MNKAHEIKMKVDSDNLAKSSLNVRFIFLECQEI